MKETKPQKRPSPTLEEIRAIVNKRMSELLKRLRAKIREQGFTQVGIEKKLGWRRGHLTSLFGRKTDLRVDHLLALCEEIDVPPFELFGTGLLPSADEVLARLLRTYAHPREALGTIQERDLRAAAEKQLPGSRGKKRQYLQDVIQWCKASKEVDARAARRRQTGWLPSDPAMDFPDFQRYQKPAKKRPRKSKSARCGPDSEEETK